MDVSGYILPTYVLRTILVLSLLPLIKQQGALCWPLGGEGKSSCLAFSHPDALAPRAPTRAVTAAATRSALGPPVISLLGRGVASNMGPLRGSGARGRGDPCRAESRRGGRRGGVPYPPLACAVADGHDGVLQKGAHLAGERWPASAPPPPSAPGMNDDLTELHHVLNPVAAGGVIRMHSVLIRGSTIASLSCYCLPLTFTCVARLSCAAVNQGWARTYRPYGVFRCVGHPLRLVAF